MFDREEKELKGIKESYSSVPVPENIDDFIWKGIREGRKQKKKVKGRFIKIAVTAAGIMLFITAIRISPTAAAVVGKIPGFDYIVKLINYDKGISDAVNNNYVQHINKSVEHEGIVFTIKDMIVDNSRALIFISLEDKSGHKVLNFKKLDLTDENGRNVAAGILWADLNKDIGKAKRLEDKIELNFTDETIIPKLLNLSIKLVESETHYSESVDNGKVLSSTWDFQIPIDKKKIQDMKKIYYINKSAVVEGQRITFKKAIVTPTRTTVDMEYDKNNSKRIFYFDDISIVNEKGEEWGTLISGITGSRIDAEHDVLYFQSSYFKDSKELYLTGSSIRALDKDKLEVAVNTEEGKLLKAPDDKLTLKASGREGEGVSLEFNLLKDKIMDLKRAFCIFSYKYKDSSGKEYEVNSQAYSASTPEERVLYVVKPDETQENIIYLTIEDYPTRIKGDFKIRIK